MCMVQITETFYTPKETQQHHTWARRAKLWIHTSEALDVVVVSSGGVGHLFGASRSSIRPSAEGYLAVSLACSSNSSPVSSSMVSVGTLTQNADVRSG